MKNTFTDTINNNINDLKSSFKSINWDKKDKGLCFCSICCGFCSFLSFILAFVVFFLIGWLVTSVITANAIVNSEDSPGYPLWQSNIDDIAPPEYECYNFFNLTNYQDIAQNISAVPKYNEVGPYCYRLYHNKTNVEWSEDGNEVSYNIYQSYVWAPEQSNGDALTDIVVNLSPGYIGILATTGTEEDLTVAFTGPTMQLNMKWLTTDFIHHTQAENQAKVLSDSQNLLTNSSNPSQFYSIWANSTTPPSNDWNGMLVSYKGVESGISQESANLLWDSNTTNSLLYRGNSQDLWFNATLPDTLNNGSSLNLAARTAARNQIAQQFNLTSSQIDMIADWLRNSYYPTSVDPWLVNKYNKSDPGIQEVTDLGWYQWGSCGVTGIKSASEKYHNPGGTVEYGCWILGKVGFFHFNVTESKQLLNGTLGLFSMVNIGYFFNDYYLIAINPTDCNDTTTQVNLDCESCSQCYNQTLICYSKKNGYTCSFLQNGTCVNQNNSTKHCATEPDGGLCYPSNSTSVTCDNCRECEDSGEEGDHQLHSSNCTNCNNCKFNETETECNKCDDCEECELFLNCYNEEVWNEIYDIWGLTYDGTINFVAYLLFASQKFAEPKLQALLYEGGGGLFPIRTVNNWIFDAKDPLMLLANPEYPNAGNLIQNMSSVDDATRYGKLKTYTGQNNISQVAVYISYKNYTSIPVPFWAEEVPIDGCTEWGQFQPFMNERDTKDLYTFDGTYFRKLHLQRTGSVKYRDVTLWRFMMSNDTLQPNPTYYQSIPGFANSSSFHQKCPIFYSNPHWQGVSDYYANRVEGVIENRNYLSDYTVVDVEPITGLVMHVNETLQVNVFLDANYSNLHKYYTPPIDTFYPIMIAYKETTLSKDNAAEYQIGVVWTAWMQIVSFPFFFGCCLICFVISISILIKLLRKNEKSPHYDENSTLISDE